MDVTQLTAVVCLLAGWTIVLLRRDRLQLPDIGAPAIKFTHALPAVLQVVLFTYWSMYWGGLLGHVPVLLFQLAFAYAFDFLLTWSLRRPYHPGLAPVPVVFSANLFVWFPPSHLFLYAVLIAVALSSKVWLRRRGRHIFNPSVLGLAVVATLCIVLPQWFHYQDISHDFDRPPYMAHLIFSLALIPQVRLGTAPVSLGAATAMLGIMLSVLALTGYRGGPDPWWPPWLLAITLLAGDPATIPSKPMARLFFGLFLGAAFYAVSRLMLVTIGTDFFSKIIPIPLANLLVPYFENAGARLAARWPGLDGVGGQRALLAAWVTVSVLMLLFSDGS